ncbi:hypothetical protein F4009_13540 [Candidatus Poribacteria bacterium]|nr:hypothetical protein [Candidatus Poribacteria bacterium]MYH83192.1 hypothetical protein [Candidatus Poribacteria bacterium]MYK94998.1 hypothetical protein [Candidatus Poribacteria bacterium]
MQKLTHLLSIVLAALFALAVSSCDESMTNQMDRVVTDTDPPTEQPMAPTTTEPVAPPTEPVVTTPEPLPPLPEGTVVFVEPRRVTSPAAGEQLQVHINVKDAADVLAYEVRVGFDPTALRYVSIANADYLPAGAFAAPPQVSVDSIYLATTSVAGSATAANGTLATVTFEVVAAKASTITLIDVLLSDSNITRLTLQTANGNISAP